jgi:hypothetical protein
MLMETMDRKTALLRQERPQVLPEKLMNSFEEKMPVAVATMGGNGGSMKMMMSGL